MATETFIIDVRTRGTKRSAADVKRIGTQASQVRKTLAFLRAALVTVAAIRVFATLTSNLVEFSDAMLVVKAVTGATTDQFARMRDVAKGLGATTRFTAGEAAEGMAFLARAGFEVNEVIGAIPATLDLAAAAQLELGNAADIASNLMTSFGLTVADMPEIMDTLVFTANNANTTVQQLADGLKLFAPIASQLGVSLKDASSAMAILGDAGIQASLAGTGVRRVLTDLEAPTGMLAKALKALNIGFEEVRPSAVGLEGALQRLKDANIGASVSSLLFGKRGGFVAAQLLRALGPMGDFREEMERIEGTAKRAAEEMEAGLGGALRLVRSALQNLLIAFADLGAEESLNQFFRGLAESLRVLARHADDVVAVFKVLIAGFAIAKIVTFGTAMFAAAGRVKFMFTSLNVIPGAALRARAALSLLKTSLLAIPFVAIAVAITGTIAALVAFRDEIKLMERDGGTLADVFTTLSDTLGDELAKAINTLGFDFKNFGEIVDGLVRRLGSGIEGMISIFIGIGAAVKNVIKRIGFFMAEFVLDFLLFIAEIKQSVNELARDVGLDDIFEGADGAVLKLQDATIKLKFALMDLPGVFDAAGIAQRKFFDDRRATTAARITAEQAAAAKIALDADLAAADRRLIALNPKEAVDAGITAEELFGSGGSKKAAKERKRLEEALRSLEASFFPLLAAEDAETETLKTINDALSKGIDLRVSYSELLTRSIREQVGATQTVKQAAEEQEVLNDAWRRGAINLEELEFLSRKAAISFLDSQRDATSGAQRAFLKLQQDATDAAGFTEAAFTDAFKNIEDAVVEFANTGEISVNSFFRNFGEQLLRLGTQQAIAGIGAGFSGALGSLGGGGSGIGGSGGFNIGSFVTGLFGLHKGGAFTVGSNTAVESLPGIDNRLVAFRAQDGEEVTVTPKGVGVGAIGPTNIVFNVQARDADSFNRSQSQLQNRLLAGIGQARRRR